MFAVIEPPEMLLNVRVQNSKRVFFLNIFLHILVTAF